MRYKTIRVKPGDAVHLGRLAEERKSTVIDILAALVAEAEAGRIYPPLCKRKRGGGSDKITVTPELGARVKVLREVWGLYDHQVVTWLLGHEAQTKPPNLMDTWARMEANRVTYEQLIAEAGA